MFNNNNRITGNGGRTMYPSNGNSQMGNGVEAVYEQTSGKQVSPEQVFDFMNAGNQAPVLFLDNGQQVDPMQFIAHLLPQQNNSYAQYPTSGQNQNNVSGAACFNNAFNGNSGNSMQPTTGTSSKRFAKHVNNNNQTVDAGNAGNTRFAKHVKSNANNTPVSNAAYVPNETAFDVGLIAESKVDLSSALNVRSAINLLSHEANGMSNVAIYESSNYIRLNVNLIEYMNILKTDAINRALVLRGISTTDYSEDAKALKVAAQTDHDVKLALTQTAKYVDEINLDNKGEKGGHTLMLVKSKVALVTTSIDIVLKEVEDNMSVLYNGSTIPKEAALAKLMTLHAGDMYLDMGAYIVKMAGNSAKIIDKEM